MDSNKPARRPVIRAVSFEEIGEAIGRLLDIAKSDTGQSQRVADFLLAWWNGDDLGHFPILHFCNCDPIIAEDMLAILAYLAQEPTTYANAWGYEDAMRALVEQKRDLEYRAMLEEAHAILAQGIDHLRFAGARASSGTDQGKARDRLAGELHKLATLLAPDRREQPEAKDKISAASRAAEAAMTVLMRSLWTFGGRKVNPSEIAVFVANSPLFRYVRSVARLSKGSSNERHDALRRSPSRHQRGRACAP